VKKRKKESPTDAEIQSLKKNKNEKKKQKLIGSNRIKS